ncbi:unnamed protein product, partial [Rotaria magnacalcarata]
WNPVSAAQKAWSGSSASGSVTLKGSVAVNVQPGVLPMQDNKSDQTAYRNCLCGHHYNYHT